MASLPGGTVTFLFTDIEGSTRLLQQLGDAVRRPRSASTVGSSGSASRPRRDRGRHTGRRVLRRLPARDGRCRRRPSGATRSGRPRLAATAPGAGADGPPHRRAVRRRTRATSASTSHRAARICSAGHGGQILLSETTRALLGNDLPEGAAVVDLGEQNLKDVQHERIFQLALEGDESFPPLKTETRKSSSDELAERIERHVEDMVEQSLKGSFEGKGKETDSATSFKWTVVGLGELVLVVLTIVVIIWLIRHIL